MVQQKLISYLESQRRPAQWGFMAQALVHEVASELSPEEARRLLVQAGLRAGQALSLPQCDSIADLEVAANQHWTDLGWGVASFIEHQDHLEIRHEAVPSEVPSIEGVGAFLEGVYQQWFFALGAGSHLHVRQQKSGEPNTLLYRFSRLDLSPSGRHSISNLRRTYERIGGCE